MKGKRLLLLTLFIGGPIVVFSLWITGFINLWFYGIGDIASNVNDYSLNIETIDGEYSVTIDLSDPESNEGKILYNDGEHQIYVSDVIVQNEGNYEVYFRTSGKYNFRRATLVSAIEHKRVHNGFTYNFKANANATYRGETFKIYESGSSGLNFNDGDHFGVYLIPFDKDVTIDIAEDSNIEVTLTNLTLHKWGRK